MVRKPYPVVVRLCGVLAERYSQIDAHYYQQPILRQRPYRIVGWVYSWAVERVAHDKLDEWLEELHDLLPWQDSTSEAAVNAESESFLNMQAKGGG